MLIRLVTMMMVLGVISACTTPSVQSTRVACEAFRPVTWSRTDTPETVAEVKGHNAAYGALCGI